MKRLMLMSNSTNHGEGYLDHAMEAILEHLGDVRRVLFVPWAKRDREEYTELARRRFAREGIEVNGLQDSAARDAIESAEAVFVGGGNTFRLLAALQRAQCIEPLRCRARQGMPYLGASAGSGIAAPSIRTTNDMPIVQPQCFEALALVPFQINAHYLDADKNSRHMGETREERLLEYLEENEIPVVGLREGSWLRAAGTTVCLEGKAGARIFRRGHDPVEAAPGDSIGALVTM